MFPLPSELVEAFANENGTVFVGAGLSMGAGLPGWQQLVAPLLQEPEMRDCPPGVAATAVAQYYDNAYGRRRLVQRLRDALGRRADPTSVHDALLALPGLSRLYTTNLDRLLEGALDRARVLYDRVWRDEHVTSPDRPLQLVKVHGDLEDPDTVVITTEDYDNFAASRPAIADQLKHHLMSTTALFLGYSFSDPDLSAILTRIRREGRAQVRRLYTVQFAPSAIAVRELTRQELTVISLDPAAHPGGPSEALLGWLRAFAAEVRRVPAPRTRRREAARNHNLPARSGEKLVGRRDEFFGALDGLRSRYPLVTIEGFAGVGKTSLAIEVAHACTTLFDYVVWVSAKDRPDQRRWLNDVLNTIGTTTDLPVVAQLPAERLADKKGQVNAHLQARQVLVVVDNFETIDDPELVEWMVHVPGASKVLVTTRNRQFARMAYAVELRGLKPAESIELMRQHARQPGLSFLSGAPEDQLLPLYVVTAGNPYAIRLALGLAAGGGPDALREVANQLHGAYVRESMAAVFDELFARSWAQLGDAARCILMTTPLFVGVSSIRRDALQAASGLEADPFAFDAGLAECERLGLLEREGAADRPASSADAATSAAAGAENGAPDVPADDGRRRYVVHSMTRTFAQRKLAERPDFEPAAQRRCSDYFLRLVRRHVTRERPDRPYWNALVSDGMQHIDPEWPSIKHVLELTDDAADPARAADFVLLLVHYMDSRFLNSERLEYVERAIRALGAIGRHAEQALLQIDALGWTYVEEDRLAKAYAEIERGLQTAAGLPAPQQDELRALGLAWQARVRIEQGLAPEAQELIDRALVIACAPWIKCRVYMAAGDIALKQRRSEAALAHYQAQSRAAQSYGDEGHGYQWLPRIGMAHLDLGNFTAAEATFKELYGVEEIEIGRLYAEYGLAMIAYKQRHDVLVARAMVDGIRERLSRRTSSNLLLKLIERLYLDLEAPGIGTPSTPARAVGDLTA